MNYFELASLEARVCLPVGRKSRVEDAGYNDRARTSQKIREDCNDSGTTRKRE